MDFAASTRATCPCYCAMECAFAYQCHMHEQDLFKLVLIGDATVGKTCILSQYMKAIQSV
eukprot:1828167-Amphidinium_carterae.1